MKIKKGDNVQIMAGKDRGKRGKVLGIYGKNGRVLIQGLNLFKKHRRPAKQGEKGELVNVPRPLAIANAMLVCGNCDKPTRIGYQLENGEKRRFCKKCKTVITQ